MPSDGTETGTGSSSTGTGSSSTGTTGTSKASSSTGTSSTGTTGPSTGPSKGSSSTGTTGPSTGPSKGSSSSTRTGCMQRLLPVAVTVSGALALLLLLLALCTDHWYETDTHRHKENCDRTGTESSDQQNRDMPIYHLPLLEYGGGTRARSKPVHVGSREDELLENWRAILGMGILETACGRPLFPAHSGLWRKCFCAGRDPDIDRLIDRGVANTPDLDVRKPCPQLSARD
ncbi:transmembrane protein 178A-like [Notothenia coriiceps]|uniref:Transmembrane protein 178A-like n=1 Tax=Notothenia coriiceps TaxID=8208 RepID=A0A6I9NP54_9TELE|nr:PREDICTED: transmembrane protein 178A-like [Notothenia coriiceps]